MLQRNSSQCVVATARVAQDSMAEKHPSPHSLPASRPVSKSQVGRHSFRVAPNWSTTGLAPDQRAHQRYPDVDSAAVPLPIVAEKGRWLRLPLVRTTAKILQLSETRYRPQVLWPAIQNGPVSSLPCFGSRGAVVRYTDTGSVQIREGMIAGCSVTALNPNPMCRLRLTSPSNIPDQRKGNEM